MHFLVYTRSASFDYQWVYGLDDKSVEDALQDYILKWLSTNLLAKLQPVTAFFQFQKYCALMIAEASDTRIDPQERPIFQRAIFLWEMTDGLSYRHLEPLAIKLGEDAEKVYRDLPNNVYRLPTRMNRCEVDVKALDRETSIINIRKCYWELPQSLTWQDIIRDKLTVEVPDSWRFDKMIAGLADLPLSPANIIFIGNSLHKDNRYPATQSWLVSAREPNGGYDSLIRVLKPDGTLLDAAELKLYQERKRLSADIPGRSRHILPTRGGTNYFSYKETGGARKAEGPNNQEELLERTTPDPTEVERLFSMFTDSIASHSKAEKWELVRLIKRYFTRDHMAIVEAETKILILLTPAIQSISSDITIAWNYLLSEILLSYQGPSTEMLGEWVRRIDRLRELTVRTLSESQVKWRLEFDDACNSLRTILLGKDDMKRPTIDLR